MKSISDNNLTTKGFTIVELLIIIIVIVILAGITSVVYPRSLKQSQMSEVTSNAAVIRNALENYYQENNEYPPSKDLLGGGTDGRAMTATHYTNAAAILKIKKDILKTEHVKLVPCIASDAPCTIANNSADQASIFYITRMPTDTDERTYRTPSSGCSYIFPSNADTGDSGINAYYLTYYDHMDDNTWTQWKMYRSNYGTVTRGDRCPLATD